VHIPSEQALTIVARMDDVVALDLTVAAIDEVTPSLRSLRLEGAREGLRPLPGQDVMVSVADAQGRHRWRRYTIRRLFDDGLELWVDVDSSGPGAIWALGAKPGDHIEVVGPRGKVRLDDHADAHVFVVDESGIAAACAMAESLAAPARVHVVAPHHDTAGTPQVGPGVVLTTSDLVVASPSGFDADRLADDLAQIVGAPQWPSLGATAGYVFGELGLTRDARGVLEALGVPETKLAIKAYWRADRANEDRGEPARS
jgi:NADPH-dependent ferric siderophore reductase